MNPNKTKIEENEVEIILALARQEALYRSKQIPLYL
jgi:hypothetical protein